MNIVAKDDINVDGTLTVDARLTSSNGKVKKPRQPTLPANPVPPKAQPAPKSESTAAPSSQISAKEIGVSTGMQQIRDDTNSRTCCAVKPFAIQLPNSGLKIDLIRTHLLRMQE